MRKFKKVTAIVMVCVMMMSVLSVVSSAQMVRIQPGMWFARSNVTRAPGVCGTARVYPGSCSNVVYVIYERTGSSWIEDSRFTLSPGQQTHWDSRGWYPNSPRDWELIMQTVPSGTNTHAETSKVPG